MRLADHVLPPSVVLYRPRSPPPFQSGPGAATYTTLESRGSTTMRAMCYGGIARVHEDVAAAGVVADFDQAGGPGLAAVGGLIQAALAAALPERPGGGHVHHVGIARIHHDAGDVLGEFESHVVEGAPAVFALVDAIAVGDAALVIVLAGAHPDDGRILGVDGNPADRVGTVIVEYGRPRRAVVGGGEDIAGGHGNQVVVGIVREYGDLGDAPGNKGRADLPRL